MTKKKKRRLEVERILMAMLPGQLDHPVLAVEIENYYVYVMAKYPTENDEGACYYYLAGEEIRRVLDGAPIEIGANWELLIPGNVNAPSTESVQ
jgi:hypothetical protein